MFESVTGARYGSASVPRVEGTHVHEVAIVGAGFGGLGMAIRLKQQGIDDFVVIERDEDVGGTWWSNSYPGCQCDIPSNLYSFSFAPNPDWDRAYPMRDQILEYLRDCADRFGVRPHVRLGSRAARRALGGRRAALGARDVHRSAGRAGAGDRARPPERAVHARAARARALPGQRLPHRRRGTTPTTSPESASR